MPKSYNHVALLGYLTRDLQTKKISDSLTRTFFTVAVDRNNFDHDNSKNKADFIPVVAWRKPSERWESMVKDLTKGSLVFVEGRISSHAFEKEKKVQWTTEVMADKIQLLKKTAEEKQKEGGI
jgi:single-strand DNA-binding protein